MWDSYISTSENGAPVPAVEAWAIEPLWVQFEALLPPHLETHTWGCHNPRIPDRIVFDKLVAKLVFGGSYGKHADQSCSATMMRTRRNEWIAAGVFAGLEQIVLETDDRVMGLDLANITVDGQITKAPCGGEVAGKSPIDRGKLGIKVVADDRRTRDPAGLCRDRREPARLPVPAPDAREARAFSSSRCLSRSRCTVTRATTPRSPANC